MKPNQPNLNLSELIKKSKFDFQPWRDLTSLGSIVFYALLSFSVLLFAEFNLFWQLLFGFVLTLAVISLTRAIYFRSRPNHRTYKNLLEKIDASSFPSVHAARCIFLALALGNHFQNFYLTSFFVLTALTIMYSRIVLKKHDWIDLTAGTVLGIIVFWISLLVF